jgi:hypothetical protein
MRRVKDLKLSEPSSGAYVQRHPGRAKTVSNCDLDPDGPVLVQYGRFSVTETREGGRIEGESKYDLGIDADTNREAIEHLMTEGSLYSTIDDLVSFRARVLSSQADSTAR